MVIIIHTYFTKYKGRRIEIRKKEIGRNMQKDRETQRETEFGWTRVNNDLV